METPYKPNITAFQEVTETPFEEYILKEKSKVNNNKLKTEIQENFGKWFDEF